jgi:endonuclease-8
VPEGDTIFRTARTLHRALSGHAVARFESVFPALTRVDEDTPIRGRTIESVAAAGKHLLMAFSGDLVLRTHMRMNGSWHIYRVGERWQRPRRDMRVVIATDTFEAVGFNIPVAEWLRGRELERHADLHSMGPDLLGDGFDEAEAIRRLRTHPTVAIADALLNQRIVAGIGNVYKSEILFICRVNPRTPLSAMTDAELLNLLSTARKLLKANVTGVRRTTGRLHPSERLYVYGRARKSCLRCGTPIQVQAQGPDARLTYWCPNCQ